MKRAVSTFVQRVAAVVPGRRRSTVRVAADADAALLSSAAALRRLGARIIRYDAEAGTLEARLPSTPGTVRVRAVAGDGEATTLRLDGDVPALMRRFRRALSA